MRRLDEQVGGDEQDEDDIEERRLALEHARAEHQRARRPGEAVVAAVGRERGGDEERHLPERQRDHDEVDAARAHGDGAGGEREQGGGGERGRQGDGQGAEAVAGGDAGAIGADAEEGRVAERHQAADADQQLQRERGDGEDHHPLADQQQIAAAENGAQQRQQRHQREQAGGHALVEGERAERCERDLGDPGRGAHQARPLAGNRPAGRTASTTAISK